MVPLRSNIVRDGELLCQEMTHWIVSKHCTKLELQTQLTSSWTFQLTQGAEVQGNDIHRFRGQCLCLSSGLVHAMERLTLKKRNQAPFFHTLEEKVCMSEYTTTFAKWNQHSNSNLICIRISGWCYNRNLESNNINHCISNNFSLHWNSVIKCSILKPQEKKKQYFYRKKMKCML